MKVSPNNIFYLLEKKFIIFRGLQLFSIESSFLRFGKGLNEIQKPNSFLTGWTVNTPDP
jgi:hypothetical protein